MQNFCHLLAHVLVHSIVFTRLAFFFSVWFIAIGGQPPRSSSFALYLSGAAGEGELRVFPVIFTQKGAPVSFKLGYSLQLKLINYVIWFVPSPKFWIILVSVGKCWGKGKRSDNHSLWFLKSIPHEYSRPSPVPVTAEKGWPNICSLKYSLFFSRQFYVKYLHCKKENESEILGKDRWSHCMLW